MIYKVKEGAKLSCTLGSCQTCLQVPISHGAKIQDKNVATIMDNKVGVNILPFGMCAKSEPPIPCTPAFTLPWVLGNFSNKYHGEPVLLNNSILPCMCGGIVKINNSGQKEDV